MTIKERNKLLILFPCYLIVSFVVTVLIYISYGKHFTFKGDHLDIDFFYTFCGVVTIIGFWIAIFQLSALRSEQQIKSDTADQVRKEMFIDEAAIEVERLIDQLITLEVRILHDSPYNEFILKDYTDRINTIVNVLTILDAKQIRVKHEVIACKNCLALLSELRSEFFRILDKNDYISFKRQRNSDIVKQVLHNLISCKENLK